MMKKIVALLAGVMAMGANATVISYSFGPFPQQITEISQTGSLGLFDSTLGTLTGVSLVLHGENTTWLSLTSKAANAQNTKATSITELSFSSDLDALNGLLSNPLITLSATTGLVTLASGQTQSYGLLRDSKDTSVGGLDTILSSFSVAGGGNFNLTCESLSGISILGGGGNIGSSQTTTAACGASLSYVYDAPPTHVPEPAMMAMLGLGVLGLSAIRRRK